MRVLLITLTILSACKSTDKVELIHEKEIHQMNRQEVINAIQDCRSANLRSVVKMADQLVQNGIRLFCIG